MSFSNEQVQADDLPNWESVIFQPISRRYLKVILINYVLTWLLVMAIAIIVLFNSENVTMTRGLLFCIAISVLFIFFMIISVFAFKKRGYAIRELDVLYKAGLVGFHTTIIPYKHIQHVKIKESFIARMFQLVTLDLYTSGAGKNLMISGLDKKNAEKLQQFIIHKITQEPAAE